jgi:hypothetical protein
MFAENLKSKSTQELETAMSRAISDVTGEELEVSIMSINYSETLSHEAIMQIKIKTPMKFGKDT